MHDSQSPQPDGRQSDTPQDQPDQLALTRPTDQVEHARHVAPGGWRRGVVGTAVGLGLGLLVSRILRPGGQADR